jgi:hypothetical protein
MNTPIFDRVFETFVMLQPGDDALMVLRHKIKPLVEELLRHGKIRWYSFLVHSRNSGVPTSTDDEHLYWHLRLELGSSIEYYDVASSLPPYCLMTRKICLSDVISGIDKSLLKDGRIEEAWRIIGEQSEWVLRMLDIHSASDAGLRRQVAQLLHYFANMAQMQVS